MFTETELRVLAACCDAELSFLVLAEKRGLKTHGQQAAISGIRAKVLDYVKSPPVDITPPAEEPPK
jgi:hypothetical protein